MPYIYVEEVAEDMEVADVVERSEYDKVIEERDAYEKQRDDAIAKVSDAEKEVRDTKAKYADYILGGAGKAPDTKPAPKVEHGALSARDLFKVKKG